MSGGVLSCDHADHGISNTDSDLRFLFGGSSTSSTISAATIAMVNKRISLSC